MSVAIVTGASRGLGEAVATGLARTGWSLVVDARDRVALRAAADRIRAAAPEGIRVVDVAGDVTDAAHRQALTDAAVALGGLDLLVNNAGVLNISTFISAPSLDAARAEMEVNYFGTLSMCRAFAPALAANGGGAIVTIASTAAIRGHGFGAGYTASKGGVDALTRLIAVQYGAANVRANCICPGGVDTPMTGGVFATDEAQARAKRHVPLGRYAQPEDIGDVAVFLLSDDARYISGQTFPVEGGATIA